MGVQELLIPLLLGTCDKGCRQSVLITAFSVGTLVKTIETCRGTDKDQHIRGIGDMEARTGVNLAVALHDLDPELIAHTPLSVRPDLPPGERLLPLRALVISDLALNHIFIGRDTLHGAAVPHRGPVQIKLKFSFL